jgi:hypothetical protein
MRLKNLIKEASDMLGLDAPSRSVNYSILFRCANLVVSGVASNVKDCVDVQDFDVTDNTIDFTKFRKTFLKVKAVKMNGHAVKHDLYMGFISVPNGNVTVEYAYIPIFKSGMDKIANVIGVISESALLYGMLSEYSSVSGLENEARYFGKRFEQALFESKKTGKGRVWKCLN